MVLAGWAVVLTLCAVLYPSLQKALGPPSYNVEGSESQQAEQLLQRRFHAIGTEDDALVFYSYRHLASDRVYRNVISAAVGTARRENGVHGVLSPFDPTAEGQIAAGEHAAVAVVALDGDVHQRYERALRLQREVKKAANNSVQVWLTGYSPLAVDLSNADKADVERAELIGVPVAFLVLLLALGALVAAIVPLFLAGMGLLLTYGLLAVLVGVVHFDAFLVSIVTMIGIGLGIDYALFIVSRFREEIMRIESRHVTEKDRVVHAVGTALATSGRTVVLSGAIVAISLMSLIVVKGPFFREIAIGAVIVVCCMLSVALILSPAVLASLGTKIDYGRIRTPIGRSNFRSPSRRASGSWALLMIRRPAIAVAIAMSLLSVAAVPLLGMHYGLNIGVFSLSNSPSGKGERILANYFSPGAVSPIQVIIANRGDRSLTTAQLTDAHKIVNKLERDRRVSGVAEHEDSGGLLLTVVPSSAIDAPATTGLVSYIRNDLGPRIRDQNMLLVVGGATAFAADLTTEVRTKLPEVLALIFGLSFLCLMIVFRSIAIPFKAVLTNLFSTTAAMGLVVLVFQAGHGQDLLGFTSPGYIQAYMPLLVFSLLFGVSMDYEVFLVRRMQEEWDRTGNNKIAVINGVEHTAGPIVAAATIMVAVFGCFVTADLLEIKQLGFALAIAVIIDATLARLVLVPAVMAMLGGWNWWLPARLSRVLAIFDSYGEKARTRRARLSTGSAGDFRAGAIAVESLADVSNDGAT